ncbi:MAG: carboxypeptidase-like regulatory domain-containing protein [Caldilineaceae bacterium]
MSKQLMRILPLPLGLAFCLFIGLTAMQTTNSQAAPRQQIAPAASDARGRIAGTVRGPGGSALKNILVRLEQAAYPSGWNETGLIQTDAEGHYTFDRLPPGTYRVSFRDLEGVYAAQYYAQATTAETAAVLNINGSSLDAVDGQLATAGSIEGSVLGAVASYGTVGAYIQVGDQWQLAGYSTLDGDMQYAIQGLPPGTYHICGASGDWYAGNPPCYDHIGGGMAWGTDVALASGSVMTGVNLVTHGLQDAATISGTVTDRLGAPLSGVRVSAMAFSSGEGLLEAAAAETDAAGSYRLEDLPAGDYVVQFQDNDGLYLRQYFRGASDVLTAELITLKRFEQRGGVSERLKRGGVITGTLTFAGPYAPVTATVLALESLGLYFGDPFYGSYDPSSGKYMIGQLPPGPYVVGARVPDPSDGRRNYQELYSNGTNGGAPTVFSIAEGSTIGGIDFDLAAGDYAGVIAGTVTGEGGQPLANMRVDLLITPYWGEKALVYVVTDAAGKYQLDGIPNGSYYLRFSDPAGVYAPAYAGDARRPEDATAIEVLQGDVRGPVDARLLRGGRIHGQVRSAAGRPKKDATVSLMLDYSTITAVKTDTMGNYDSGPLSPGSYHVCAEAPSNYGTQQYACLGYEYGATWPGLQVPLQADETVQEDLVFGYVPQLPYKQYLPAVAGFTLP